MFILSSYAHKKINGLTRLKNVVQTLLRSHRFIIYYITSSTLVFSILRHQLLGTSHLSHVDETTQFSFNFFFFLVFLTFNLSCIGHFTMLHSPDCGIRDVHAHTPFHSCPSFQCKFFSEPSVCFWYLNTGVPLFAKGYRVFFFFFNIRFFSLRFLASK